MNYTKNNISSNQLKAAKEALADAIEGTAVLAGLTHSGKDFSRENLQEAKDCLSLLLRITNNIMSIFSAGTILITENNRYRPCIGWNPSGKPGGAKYGRDVVCCSHHLSAGLLSFNKAL